MRRALVVCLAGLGLAGLTLIGSIDIASARIRHHHRHYARTVPRHFVFPTPEEVSLAHTAGQFGGYFETGILGPTTADPYEQPGYGYYNRGYKGPGYGYPGY